MSDADRNPKILGRDLRRKQKRKFRIKKSTRRISGGNYKRAIAIKRKVSELEECEEVMVTISYYSEDQGVLIMYSGVYVFAR